MKYLVECCDQDGNVRIREFLFGTGPGTVQSYRDIVYRTKQFGERIVNAELVPCTKNI